MPYVVHKYQWNIFAVVTSGQACYKTPFPTGPFTILEHRDQEMGKFYVVQQRRTTDFESPKL